MLVFKIPRDPEDATVGSDNVIVPPEVVSGRGDALQRFYVHECEKRWQRRVNDTDGPTKPTKRGKN